MYNEYKKYIIFADRYFSISHIDENDKLGWN